MRAAGVAIASVAATALIAVVAAAVTIAAGVYDFGADARHMTFVTKVIAFARERSIDVRSGGIHAPPLDSPAMIAEGAEHYDAMCTGCHLAPGMRENEMRPGLNPKPPALASLPAGNPAEQFWIVKHGLKMTAMPSWGTTHSDEEIWNMVAFLQKLPGLTPQQYRAAVARAHGEHQQMDMPH